VKFVSKGPIVKLERFWQKWEAPLQQLVQARGGAKLIFPVRLDQQGPPEGSAKYTIKPTQPIAIFNAPTKASSKRGSGDSVRLAIFIHGSFELEVIDAETLMSKADCNVSFFKTKIEGHVTTLTLFDALHFDFELPDKQTSFHPIFHAQRGVSRNVSEPVVRAIWDAQFKRGSAKLVVVIDTPPGTPYLRLPTPQLDIFSVLTLVLAGFFCNPGDKLNGNPHTEKRFKHLLSLLMSSENLVREGKGARSLMNRFRQEDPGFISTAHWYAESGTV
jgi:hypothetical protein